MVEGSDNNEEFEVHRSLNETENEFRFKKHEPRMLTSDYRKDDRSASSHAKLGLSLDEIQEDAITTKTINAPANNIIQKSAHDKMIQSYNSSNLMLSDKKY